MKHFLNGIEITPRNRTAIGIQSDFTGAPMVLELTTETIQLPREGFDIIKNHIQTVGLFEGVPYTVQLDGGVTLEYYVDLTENTKVQQHEVEVTLKKRKGYDNWRERAEGTTFELMLTKGVQFDTFNVPYFIIQDNQLETAITLLISIYVMTREAIDAGKELVEAINEIIKASVPVGAPIPGPDWGAIVLAVLKAIFRLAYFALILVALLDLATKFFVLVFPPKRNFKASKFKELMLKSCAYLGYQFQSTLLDSEPGWTLLPVPLIRDRQSIFEFLPDEFFAPTNKGVPSSSDTTPTILRFFEACETMFNARTKVYNGVVQFERWDFWADQTTNNLMPALNLQGQRDEAYTFNTSDIWKRYYIKYENDFTDLHCIDAPVYDNHDAEFSTEPLNVINADLVTIKNLQEVQIPFALGARKSKLNWLELLAKAFFEIIDSVTGLFGGGTSYATQIGDRKDALKISQAYFQTTKVLYTVNGKQQSDYFNKVSAKSLWDRFHYINQIQLNGWIIRENVPLRLTSQDFVNLLGNNFADINGKICEILTVKWLDETSTAEISYREPNEYALGKVETIIINL